jgi:hypothetical protein
MADRLTEAISLSERSVADLDRVLGANHPRSLTAQANLASIYATAGRLEESIALCEQTLMRRERVLGPGHPDTLASRQALVRVRAYRSQPAGVRGDGQDDDDLCHHPKSAGAQYVQHAWQESRSHILARPS